LREKQGFAGENLLVGVRGERGIVKGNREKMIRKVICEQNETKSEAPSCRMIDENPFIKEVL
jgi:hypothetical protein